VDIELSKVRERLQERGLRLVLEDESRLFIIKKGQAEGGLDYGARPLRRSVEHYIEDPLAEELLKGNFEGRNVITVKVAEVGDQQRLEFVGSTETIEEPVPVAAGVDGGEGDGGGETVEATS
jgi:ATP-dependent Clp protease ATP-binding subunit ClpC